MKRGGRFWINNVRFRPEKADIGMQKDGKVLDFGPKTDRKTNGIDVNAIYNFVRSGRARPVLGG